MSKASNFHPKLETLEVAKFQLIEQGFAGVTNGVTLVPAKDAVTGERVAVIVVFKPGVEAGTFNVQPMARMIDPWDVVEPDFEHTDGAGNVKGDSGTDDNPPKLNGSGSDGDDS